MTNRNDALIHFLVGEQLYSFYGRIDVTTKIDYQFERKHISELNLVYREGMYFKDTLTISLLVDDIKQYENMYYACFYPATETIPGHAISGNDARETYKIEWKTPTGITWRRVRQVLPYPSKVRFFKGVVEFSVQTEAYTVLLRNMGSLTKNRKWNRSTIGNTVWN